MTAQTPGYTHQVIGTRDGLQSSKIFALHQDAGRRLWIGTELGISTYNGYNFKNIQYSSNNEQLGRILAITTDKAGGTWIGGDKGLFYFYNNGLKKISFKGRSSVAIENLVTDVAGNVWIGELEGLYRVDAIKINSFYTTSLGDIETGFYRNFNKRVHSLDADKYGNIYAGGFEGVHILKPQLPQVKLVWKNPDPQNFVRSVTALSPDSIYWNCYDSHPMKKINGQVTSMPNPSFIGRLVFTHNGHAYALTTDGVAGIVGNEVKPIVSSENLSNLVYDALIDAEENIWLASWEGLIKFRKTAFKQFNLEHPMNTDAFSFLETTKGELLIGGNRGLIFIKKEDRLVPHKSFPKMFEKAEVMTMYEHTDGSLWFGSGYQGITRFKNKRIRNWHGRSGELQNNNCESIFAAGNGKIFASTEKGVTIIDPSREDAIQGFFNFKKNYTLYPELFGGITIDNDWLFYGSQGLYKLRNGLLQDDSITGIAFPSVYINKIVKDKYNNFWVATLGHGLLRCRVKAGGLVLQKQFNKRSGLPSDDILSVLVDKNNNVWSADYMSLSMVSNENINQVISFNEQDGLLKTYYQTLKLEQQKDGTIWGITSMGIFAFHPDSLNRNLMAPVLSINEVAINRNDKDSRLVIYDNALTGRNNFSYKQNSIQFNFTAISLTDPMKVRYAYRIKELDSNWNTGTARSAVYNFLRPGKYSFEVKASNNNNVWTSKPVRFSFVIATPFWQTWWFISLCMLLMALVVYYIFKSRVRRIKDKAAIRQQLAELEGKALRAQMNPHFIFNSLNAIQECIVMEKIDAAYEYLARFSKLLRMVLNNSEKNFISLQEEMEMINLYIELESLRFKNSFKYSIVVDENIDLEMTEVPPLLLQPIIENAIWHGLRIKQGEKKLSITCTSSDDGISCTITDNGIGRAKAQEIKSAKIGATNFESKGMLLSEQRMRMMNLEQQGKFEMRVEDLYNDENFACGTKVIIQLPQPLH